VLDLSKLTFDQVNFKIMQEGRKFYARNLVEPLYVTMEKEIVLNNTINLEMITSAGTAFVTATELNVGRMSKQIMELQNKL